MWVALYIGLFWLALSMVAGALWGIIAAGGWRLYWRNVRDVFAPSNVSEHGDLRRGALNP